jgi:hypothetical protein
MVVAGRHAMPTPPLLDDPVSRAERTTVTIQPKTAATCEPASTLRLNERPRVRAGIKAMKQTQEFENAVRYISSFR